MGVSHLVPDVAQTTAPDGPWLKLSAALTDCVATIAQRQDLLVRCAPGAGRGAPGCFVPALATIELAGAHLGADPRTCDPSRPSDRDRYPVLWGALVHEAAHADHSRWEVPNGASDADSSAAVLLEESRIEAAHLARRSGDRHWIRAAIRTLVLADFDDAAMTKRDAAQAAGLLLARVDNGVLDEGEVSALTAVVTKVLGRTRLAKLRRIWRKAHTIADDDANGMLELGRRWCKAIGTNADRVRGGKPGLGRPSPLIEAVRDVLDAVVAASRPSTGGGSVDVAVRAAERTQRERSANAACRVFAGRDTAGSRAGAPDRRLRLPTPDEQAAARRLARALRDAAHRERAATTTTSLTPPGRLRMRAALAADAQRAAGVAPTAEPFTRTVRRHVPSPPLRLGIVCDASGSMDAVVKPVASAAWILARAAAHIPDARSATVVFAERAHPLTHPGAAPSAVREFPATGGTLAFCDALDALDGALELCRPGAARLLTIVSDGELPPGERLRGQERVARMTKAGCAVLWLALGQNDTPLDGVEIVTLANPADAVEAIARAAVRSLAAVP